MACRKAYGSPHVSGIEPAEGKQTALVKMLFQHGHTQRKLACRTGKVVGPKVQYVEEAEGSGGAPAGGKRASQVVLLHVELSEIGEHARLAVCFGQGPCMGKWEGAGGPELVTRCRLRGARQATSASPTASSHPSTVAETTSAPVK